jgi:predicted RNase H-like nuclease (RuvC/YqgF family)
MDHYPIKKLSELTGVEYNDLRTKSTFYNWESGAANELVYQDLSGKYWSIVDDVPRSVEKAITTMNRFGPSKQDVYQQGQKIETIKSDTMILTDLLKKQDRDIKTIQTTGHVTKQQVTEHDKILEKMTDVLQELTAFAEEADERIKALEEDKARHENKIRDLTEELEESAEMIAELETEVADKTEEIKVTQEKAKKSREKLDVRLGGASVTVDTDRSYITYNKSDIAGIQRMQSIIAKQRYLR